jgi:hypothetical protein
MDGNQLNALIDLCVEICNCGEFKEEHVGLAGRCKKRDCPCEEYRERVEPIRVTLEDAVSVS